MIGPSLRRCILSGSPLLTPTQQTRYKLHAASNPRRSAWDNASVDCRECVMPLDSVTMFGHRKRPERARKRLKSFGAPQGTPRIDHFASGYLLLVVFLRRAFLRVAFLRPAFLRPAFLRPAFFLDAFFTVFRRFSSQMFLWFASCSSSWVCPAYGLDVSFVLHQVRCHTAQTESQVHLWHRRISDVLFAALR